MERLALFLVDKSPAPTYYFPIMASERIPHKIGILLDEPISRAINADCSSGARIQITCHWLRNLDMALAGDLDGDGSVELLLPDQTLTKLGGIRRTAEGAEVNWTIPIGGRATTNIAAVTTADGSLIIGVGRQDDVLRIWPSH